MAVQQKCTMRVVVTEGDIRKLTMTTRPDTLEYLIDWLKGTLQASYSFDLQFQDPKCNNELCNLTDLSALPTIKIIPVIELIPVHETCSDTSSQADTDILSVSSSDRSSQWPDVFEIPKFPVDVEYRLR